MLHTVLTTPPLRMPDMYLVIVSVFSQFSLVVTALQTSTKLFYVAQG